MAKEKIDLIKEYLNKLFNATATMHKKEIVELQEIPYSDLFSIVLKADVGNHTTHVFKGDKRDHIAWNPQSPFLEIYEDANGTLGYWMPNHLTVNVNHVYNALKFHFGTVWNVTLEEYINHQKKMTDKHWPGYHRYEMYKMHIWGCKYDRKNGLKPRA